MTSVAEADEADESKSVIGFQEELQNAKQLVEKGNLVEGIKLLHELAAATRVPAVFMQLGDAYNTLGEAEMAIATYSKAIAVPAEEPELMSETYAKRGRLFFDAGRFREAVDDFSQAVEFAPANSKLHYGRGLAALNMAREHPDRDAAHARVLDLAIKAFDRQFGLAKTIRSPATSEEWRNYLRGTLRKPSKI